MRENDSIVARREPEDLVVGETGVLRLVIERAHIVAARGQSGTDPRPGDIVVEEKPHARPVRR